MSIYFSLITNFFLYFFISLFFFSVSEDGISIEDLQRTLDRAFQTLSEGLEGADTRYTFLYIRYLFIIHLINYSFN